jgi:hypothetical protein
MNVSSFKLFVSPTVIIFFLSFTQSIMSAKLNKEYYEYEKKLIDKLTTNYNLLLRPNGTVQVQLAVNLIQIIEILEKDQIMVLNAFIDQKWNDKRLAWSIFKIDYL